MLVKKAILRGMIPFVIMAVISSVMKHQKMDPFQVKSTFLVGIIVSSVAAASVIYEIEHWSLLKQSGVHFIAMLCTVFPCLLVSGWFELHTFRDYLKVFGIFLSFGIALWAISYVVFGKLLGR
ncbi:MAG: DUF3021 family protein [Firmicutes bacterium]|nr:DUF3021 family protein [Bacillota bacterium]